MRRKKIHGETTFDFCTTRTRDRRTWSLPPNVPPDCARGARIRMTGARSRMRNRQTTFPPPKHSLLFPCGRFPRQHAAKHRHYWCSRSAVQDAWSNFRTRKYCPPRVTQLPRMSGPYIRIVNFRFLTYSLAKHAPLQAITALPYPRFIARREMRGGGFRPDCYPTTTPPLSHAPPPMHRGPSPEWPGETSQVSPSHCRLNALPGSAITNPADRQDRTGNPHPTFRPIPAHPACRSR